MNRLFTILILLISLACKAQKGGKGQYVEDLSKVAPKYTYDLDSILYAEDTTQNSNIEFQFAINDELTEVLDSIVVLNKNIKYLRGYYKVLAYSGSNQEEALEVRKEVINALDKEKDFVDEETDFVWHQPTYRVYVGGYRERLKAVRIAEYLRSFKFDFKNENLKVNPLVVPSKIQIRE